MFLLATVIKTVCIYCVASAVMSTSLFVLSLIGRDWEDSGQLVFSGIIVVLITLMASLFLYNQANPSPDIAANDPRLGPPIVSVSNPAKIELAKHLTASGAKMYSAYWCPHCHEQKELFGQEATKLLPYVECDPNGINPQADLCQSKQVRGYPTWEIAGQFYSGRQTLEDLANYSGYPGDRNF
jgi:thiol-disulfide isomerase/thioredoxin